MSKNVRTQIGKVVGKSLDAYHKKIKPTVDELKFKEQYQGRIIDCMVGEVDDNYIETPETDAPIVKLEHSKEGVVKIPSVKGKTILVDADGNETDTPAEGCKLVSVGEDEDNKLIILSKNKNLFDNSERVNGYYWSADNTETRYDNSYLSRAYIKVNQETYVTNGNTQVLEYDKNKNFIRRVQVTNAIYIPNENVGYIRLSYYNQGIDFKGQFELSNKSTTYTEPKQHKTEILLNEPLRSLPNGVCDEIVGNQLIRRVGLKVLTTKNCKWSSWNVRESDVLFFCHAGYYFENAKTLKIENCRSNRFEFRNTFGNVNGAETEHFGGYLTNPHIAISKTHATSLSEVAEYFDNNLFQVLYELEEPIIEELPNGITLQGFDDTTMYIENSITPTVTYGYNALIPYKQELSNQREEVEINTLDIENNIIPYLMDMEFNLMTMEDNE